MKIKNIITTCKKHGETEHAIYSYNGYPTVLCVKCTREKKRKRMNDPIAYAHDRAYSKQWASSHRDRLNLLSRMREQKIREQKEKECDIFIKENEEYFLMLLNQYESSLTFDDIKRFCLKRKALYRVDLIKNHIITDKKNLLLRTEQFRQSARVKYFYGIWGNGFNNYASLPEEDKTQIRIEYMQKAKEIVDKKIQALTLKI